MTTRDYVLQPKLLSGARPKIINLARSYNYQTDGYYASLLAEARGHRVVPTVETLLDLHDRDIPDDTASILEELIHKDLAKFPDRGPAIVETSDTTVVVHPRTTLRVDALDNFEITFK
jgi:hypothetical protein